MMGLSWGWRIASERRTHAAIPRPSWRARQDDYGVRNLLALALVLVLLATACGGGTAATAQQPSHDHRHGMVHEFHDAAAWAKVFDDPARDAWQRPADVMHLLDLHPGMTVADLGAGTGYFEPHLAHLVGPTGHVLALDVEPEMVQYLRDRAARDGLANVEARVVAPDDPALPPRGVDRVLIVDTWHHLRDREAYARKLAAGLTAGGTVTVVDFTRESAMGPPVSARLAPDQVVAELSAGGLHAAVVAETLPEQYVVVARRR
jgi:SAM-dependent methyltransferase